MAPLSIVVLAANLQQRLDLQALVERTGMACAVSAGGEYPAREGDAALRHVEEVRPDVVLVDIPQEAPEAALRAIELLRSRDPRPAVFASGDASDSSLILTAVRAGAVEFLERPASKSTLVDALVRVASSASLAGNRPRGKLSVVLNAKGGSGATTIAVNTALSLAATSDSVALVDLALFGHAKLHLNLKPAFTILDAASNVQRLDSTLLEQFMVRYGDNLRFLAAPDHAPSGELSAAEVSRILSILVERFDHVLVDLSTRFDAVAACAASLADRVLLIAQADVPALWSAAKVRQSMEARRGDEVQLVLNRYTKIPGFSDAEVESATQMKVLCRIPNHYAAVAASIDRGVPLVQEKHSELVKAFAGLAANLSRPPQQERSRGSFLFALTR